MKFSFLKYEIKKIIENYLANFAHLKRKMICKQYADSLSESFHIQHAVHQNAPTKIGAKGGTYK